LPRSGFNTISRRTEQVLPTCKSQESGVCTNTSCILRRVPYLRFFKPCQSKQDSRISTLKQKGSLLPFLIWLALFYSGWLVLVLAGGLLEQTLAHWPMAVAAGSYVAGSTPMGAALWISRYWSSSWTCQQLWVGISVLPSSYFSERLKPEPTKTGWPQHPSSRLVRPWVHWWSEVGSVIRK